MTRDKTPTAPLLVVGGTGVALTDHAYSQQQIAAGFKAHWRDEDVNLALLDRFFGNVQVEQRHLALPIEAYPDINDFTEANEVYREVGVGLAERSVRSALDSAGLEPADIDAIFFTSVTGVSVPTIDALLMNRMPFRRDLKRYPLFGLGCVAGAAGMGRVADYLKAWPDHVAVLLSVELCSLTLQKSDFSVPAIVAAALFGDGSAAVVGLGANRAPNGSGDGAVVPAPKVIATRSVFYPETERAMGWDIGTDGFSVVLSADVPAIVEDNLRGDIELFVAEHGLQLSDIESWVCHPGGPKIIEAIQRSLDLTPDDLSITWDSLRSIGNLSSASVLFILHDTLRKKRKPEGSYGIQMAMGPGFCSELVLFQW